MLKFDRTRRPGKHRGGDRSDRDEPRRRQEGRQQRSTMPNQFAFGLDTINIILRLSNMKSNTIIFVLFVLVSGINAFSWHEQCRLGALQTYINDFKASREVSLDNKAAIAVALMNCYVSETREKWQLECSKFNSTVTCVSEAATEDQYRIFSRLNEHIDEILVQLIQDLLQKHHIDQLLSAVDAHEEILSNSNLLAERTVDAAAMLDRTSQEVLPKIEHVVQASYPIITVGNTINPVLASIGARLDTAKQLGIGSDVVLITLVCIVLGVPMLINLMWALLRARGVITTALVSGPIALFGYCTFGWAMENHLYAISSADLRIGAASGLLLLGLASFAAQRLPSSGEARFYKANSYWSQCASEQPRAESWRSGQCQSVHRIRSFFTVNDHSDFQRI